MGFLLLLFAVLSLPVAITAQVLRITNQMRREIKARITLYVFIPGLVYILGHVAIAWWRQEWLSGISAAWTLLFFFLIHATIWFRGGPLFDIALITRAFFNGNPGDQNFLQAFSAGAVSFLRHVGAVVLIIGTFFIVFPIFTDNVPKTESASALLCLAVFFGIYLHTSQGFNWPLRKGVSLYGMLLMVVIILVNATARPWIDYWAPTHKFYADKAKGAYFVTAHNTFLKICYDCKFEGGKFVSGSMFGAPTFSHPGEWYKSVTQNPVPVEISGIPMLPLYESYMDGPASGFHMDRNKVIWIPYDHLRREYFLPGDKNKQESIIQTEEWIPRIAWLLFWITLTYLSLKMLKKLFSRQANHHGPATTGHGH